MAGRASRLTWGCNGKQLLHNIFQEIKNVIITKTLE
jgi:hypothetical protein